MKKPKKLFILCLNDYSHEAFWERDRAVRAMHKYEKVDRKRREKNEYAPHYYYHIENVLLNEKRKK